MIIQYCSDLHLEFPQNKKFLNKNPIIPKGEILILGGDIVPFQLMDDHQDFFNYVSDNFEQTFWIAGNHEYYGFDIATKKNTFKETIRSNIFLINNQVIRVKSADLIFSTLWSHIPEQNYNNVLLRLADFNAIKNNKKGFTPADYNTLHLQDKSFIMEALKNNKAAHKMVITHHVPTFLNYPLKYKRDVLNVAFATELNYLLENSTINYWQYGHHHVNTPNFEIGETTLITNQLGYVKYKENKGFNRGAIIEIS